MNARGISLIEVLLACALVALVGGGVAALAWPLRSALSRSEGIAHLEPAGRAAVDAMARDLREAGADPEVADRRWRLWPLVLQATPLRDLDSDDAVARGGALQVRGIGAGAAQGVLSANVGAGSAILLLDTTARCAGGPPSCSFRAGDVCVLYSDAVAEPVVVFAVGPGTVVLAQPVVNAFAGGAVLAAASTTRYGTRLMADGSRQLVRVSTGGAEQPVLDNVVDFEVSADAGDPADAAQITLRLRLEAPFAALRGPAGYLFGRAGTATDARQWLPDVQMLFTVALRNRRGVG